MATCGLCYADERALRLFPPRVDRKVFSSDVKRKSRERVTATRSHAETIPPLRLCPVPCL